MLASLGTRKAAMADANRPTRLPRPQWFGPTRPGDLPPQADAMLYRAPRRMEVPRSATDGIMERPPSVIMGGRAFAVADSAPVRVRPQRHLADYTQQGGRGVYVDIDRRMAPRGATLPRPIDALEADERYRRRMKREPGAQSSTPTEYHRLGRFHADYATSATSVNGVAVQAEHNFVGGRVARSTVPENAQARIPKQTGIIVSDRDQAPGDPILPRGGRSGPFGSAVYRG